MKYDELAFVNQQLAVMLREGIPLEGGLRHLCATMQRGSLRAELQLLETDLAAGAPLAQAAQRRKLPEFYKLMLQIGARSHDLPGLLTLLADYYQNANLLLTRLKGLMVYPAIVLTLSAAFSIWIMVLFQKIYGMMSGDKIIFGRFFIGGKSSLDHVFPGPPFLWGPVVLITLIALPAIVLALAPGLQRELRWRLPAFREACLARLASTASILLKAGCSLDETFSLLEKMEGRTRAGRELRRWHSRCADGRAKFSDLADGGKIFPPMFVWLVAGAGEDLAAGFARAAEVYQARADYRSNVLLYAALPSSLLFLGLVILAQITPLAQFLFRLPTLFGR